MRYAYVYDANNNKAEELRQNWNTVLSSWINSGKYLFNYNSNNSLKDYTNLTWNNTTFTWQNSSRATFAYNIANEETERVYFVWNSSTSSWDNSSKETYERLIGSIYYANDEYSGWNGSYYAGHNRIEYICAQYSVGIIENGETTFELYPNPVTSNHFSIKVMERDTYSIADVSGKILQTGDLQQGENQIQFDAIATGIYFVRIGQSVRKLIVQ
jgi:hypothetical protein